MPLPVDQREEWPRVRLLTRADWGGGKGTAAEAIRSAADWTIWPVEDSPLDRAAVKQRPGSLRLLRCSRAALPEIGEAQVVFEAGRINGRDFTAPELNGQWLRIQFLVDNAWQTWWVGRIEGQRDESWPAADYPCGTRTYHARELIAIMEQWPLLTHAYRAPAGSVVRYPCWGVPSFNHAYPGKTAQGNMGAVASFKLNGDAEPNVGGRIFTTRAGGDQWADIDILQWLTTFPRPAGEPWLYPGLGGYAPSQTNGFVESVGVWSFPDGSSALSALSQIANWRRGRGIVWTECSDINAGATTGGQLAATLGIASIFSEAFTIPDPAGGSEISITAGTSVAVTLSGDHRCGPRFAINDVFAHRVDAVWTEGEKIQVACTLSYYDESSTTTKNIVKDWTTADTTTFDALNALQAKADRWRPVWNRHALWDEWEGLASAWTTARPAIWRTDDAGGLQNVPSTEFNPADLTILPDLPFLEGYRYHTATPEKADGASTGAETGAPTRRPAFVVFKLTGGGYEQGDTSGNTVLRIDGTRIWIETGGDAEGGVRSTGPSDSPHPLSEVGCTVCMEMPSPVSMLSGNYTTAAALKSLTIPECHLWLAVTDTVCDLDTETDEGLGYAVRRAAANPDSTSRVCLIRDDRRRLSIAHGHASRWYLTEYPRKSCEWSIYGHPLSDQQDGTAWPTMGQIVSTMTAAGATSAAQTPVSRIDYDHETGMTTWATDWADLEWTR